jgi:hypothetical protein
VPFDYEASRAKTQETLIAFLQAELKIGSTFVQTGLLARDAGHMDHCTRTKQNALQAAEVISRFKDQVTDRTVGEEIEKQHTARRAHPASPTIPRNAWAERAAPGRIRGFEPLILHAGYARILAGSCFVLAVCESRAEDTHLTDAGAI